MAGLRGQDPQRKDSPSSSSSPTRTREGVQLHSLPCSSQLSWGGYPRALRVQVKQLKLGQVLSSRARTWEGLLEELALRQHIGSEGHLPLS